MNRLRLGLLPLEDLDATQFEAFVLYFLASNISLAVIDPSQEGTQKTSKAARYQITTATLYGSSGPAGQRGIDIKAVTETGAEWVFQCKHYTSPFNSAKAKQAIAKAELEYPAAARYFLVLGSEPTLEVRDLLESQPKWELWGPSELSVKFFNEVARPKQIEILRRVFPQNSDALIMRLYPQHDDLLVTADQYFERWLDEKNIFNHHATLVGRQKSLQALHDFVEDPELQAFILSAPGGVGKTRLLRALGDTFSSQHPAKKLFFIDPFARPASGSDRLRAADKNEFVVVQDDAHRAESLRPDIAVAVIEKTGKLVFSTRPQAVENLRAWLSRVGVDDARIKVLELRELGREDLVALARETLSPTQQANAELIVERAHGSPLIVSVAARLIAKGKFSDYLTSADFQRAVFDRFEEDGFSGFAPAGDELLVRDTLRLVAVLAPWKQETVSIDLVTGILKCAPRQFQDNFDRLRAAGLLVETSDGWRVIPDLFADHLVYRGCYEKNGQLTPFATELQSKLLAIATGTILRNLAEAEWQAQLEGRQIESLLDPFWAKIRTDFAASDFFERSQLIKEWARFGVLQPQRSLLLAQLAIELTDAPKPDGRYIALSHHNHGQVMGQLPGLLEPIAIYQPQFRTAALNMLWQLHRLRKKFDQGAQNDPLNAIGKVAKFQVRLPVDTSLAVVEWLAGKLSGPDAAALCEEPSPALAVILKPVFEHDVADNYTSGNTFHFRSWALNFETTRKVRSRALKVLETLVIPRGEIAVLNALAVLTAAIDIVRRRVRMETEDVVQTKWVPERLAGLSLIERILAQTDSPLVIYKIDHLLRSPAYRDEQTEFKAQSIRLQAMIPDNAETRLTRILLSNAHEEFFHHALREEGNIEDEFRNAEKRWLELTNQVASEFLSKHPSSSEFLAAAESVANHYAKAGVPAQFSDLFSAAAMVNPALAAECIDQLLATASSPLDYWWNTLFATRPDVTDARFTAWARSVLRSGNFVRWRALHNPLRWIGTDGLTPELNQEIAEWAGRLDNSTLPESLLSFHWTGFRGKPLDNVVLENLELDHLSDDNLVLVSDALEKIKYEKEGELPPEFLKKFVGNLERVARLDKFDRQHFLKYLAEHDPRAFYDMLLARVRKGSVEGAEEIDFLPISYHPEYVLVRLPDTPGYDELARALFAELRASPEKHRHHWQQLFQIAVLQVSPTGLEMIRAWANATTSAADLESLIETMKFEGSMIIFREPELTRKILHEISRLALGETERLIWYLGHTASPQMRGYTNHELNPEHRYYREEAAKAAAVHATDPNLGPFYREIVKAEDGDAARNRRWVDLQLSGWN